MASYITKKNIFYRFQQLLILLAHLALLYWILFALRESGSLEFDQVLFHFLGMAVYGALLIRGCAFWAKYHHNKSLKNHP